MKDRQELVDLGLGDVTHTRLNSGGQKPGITTKEILVRTKNTESKFVPAVRKPKDYEIKKNIFHCIGGTDTGNHAKSHLYF